MGRVPGTFKNPPPDRLTPRHFPDVTDAYLAAGHLYAKVYMLGECGVIITLNPDASGGEPRWHLSISHPDRYPTWDEIKSARYLAAELEDVPLMGQLLPRMKENNANWVNLHDNVFQLHEIRDAGAGG